MADQTVALSALVCRSGRARDHGQAIRFGCLVPRPMGTQDRAHLRTVEPRASVGHGNATGTPPVGRGMTEIRYDTPVDCIAFDPRLAHVDCMVDATYDEYVALWTIHASESEHRVGRGRPWKEDGLGKSTCIGVVDGQPLCVTWSFAVVSGAVLCFYEPTSLAQDQEQVAAWASAICSRGVSAHNFTRDVPGYTPPSVNVGLYEAARERLLCQMRAVDRAR